MKVNTVQRNPLLTSARGCGQAPIAGGIYAVVETGFGGIPVWSFLMDNTWPIPEGFGLSAIGMQFRPRMKQDGNQAIGRNGNPIYDLWDHIGSSGYKNPASWVEEVANLGFHQLLSPNLKFELISEETVYYAVHDRAHIVDCVLYQEDRQPLLQTPLCPFDIHEHYDGTLFSGTCPGLLWEDLIGGESLENTGRRVRVTMPSFTYEGYSQLTPDIEHQPAAFFKLPIGLLAQFNVYQDISEQEKHVKALEELERLESSLRRVNYIPYQPGE